ncbi:MAG TPA: hypothetical protein VI391_00210, partial [Thermoanaerobaculia bacterium]
AGTLRSLAANRSAANREAFARELQMRYARVANEAVEAANRMSNARISADVEQLQALLARGLASDEQMSAFNRQLGVVAEELNSRAAFARLGEAEQQLGHISLADEQAASRSLQDVEASLANVDRARSLGADVEYLAMMEMESRTMSRATADELQLAARQLEAKAQANQAMFAADEAQLASRLSEIESALGTRFNAASMVNSRTLGVEAEQLASRVQSREAAARSFSRQLDARQAQ